MSTELYNMIGKKRAQLQDELDALIADRDRTNEEIKRVRAELDDLPVRKVRRPKKASPGSKLADEIVAALPADE